jgi:hypothetical protein
VSYRGSFGCDDCDDNYCGDNCGGDNDCDDDDDIVADDDVVVNDGVYLYVVDHSPDVNKHFDDDNHHYGEILYALDHVSYCSLLICNFYPFDMLRHGIHAHDMAVVRMMVVTALEPHCCDCCYLPL